MKNLNTIIYEFQTASKGVINFDKLALYISTFHSTSIEGSTLTENEVINLLTLNKTAPKKPFEHHLMVSDYYNAMNFVLGDAKRKKGLSEHLIKEIGALVKKNTGSLVNTALGEYDTSKGEYRLSGVYAGKRQFPDSKKVPKLMKELIENINNELSTITTNEDKLKLSFRIHFEFVTIHPFGDGNGRTARLLMNYIQSYYELPISLVYKQDKMKYVEALEKAREKEDLEPFYKFMFKQYEKFLKQEIKLLKPKS